MRAALLRPLALLALAVAAGGCAPPPPRTPAGAATGTGPLDDPTGDTYTYVIDSFTIDTDDTGATPQHGFDFDGLFTVGTEVSGCMYPDSASPLDPDQNCPAGSVDALGVCNDAAMTGCRPGAACRGGVDNQLPHFANVVSTLIDYPAFINTTIATHRRVYLLRVSGVQSLVDDPGVTVSLYEGVPTFTSDCAQVLPDREYLVTRASLRDGATTLGDARFRVRGRIRAGRLDVLGGESDVLTLPMPSAAMVPGGVTDVPDPALHAPRLRVDLTPALGANGNLGGRARTRELIASFCTLSPTYCEFWRSTIGGMADIDPYPPVASGLCYDSQQRVYGDISAGLGFTLVRARIRTDPSPIADARPPGACGG